MGLLDYVFDNDYRQRNDIEELKLAKTRLTRQAVSANRSERDKLQRIQHLEEQVGELALLAKTLLNIVITKALCSAEEAAQIMRKLDLEDGVEDGQITPGQPRDPSPAPVSAVQLTSCPGCHRKVRVGRKKCIYCGQELSED